MTVKYNDCTDAIIYTLDSDWFYDIVNRQVFIDVADSIVMRLSVVMNKQDFVSTNFTFFDCNVHTS